MLRDLFQGEKHKIFGNVSSILELSKHMVDALEPRLFAWSETQCIGDVFFEQVEHFEPYIQYCSKQKAAVPLFSGVPNLTPHYSHNCWMN